jgi:DNA-binding LacI/PurR family transcriptional regulator
VIIVDDVFDALAKGETPGLYEQIRHAAAAKGVSPVFFQQKKNPENSKKLTQLLKATGKSDVVVMPYASLPAESAAFMKERKLYSFVNQALDLAPVSVELNRDEAFLQAADYLAALSAQRSYSGPAVVVSLSDTVSRRRELKIFEQTLKQLAPLLKLEILVLNRESEREKISGFLKKSAENNPVCWLFFAGKYNSECFEAVGGTMIPIITENTQISLFEVFNINASVNLDWEKGFETVFGSEVNPVMGAALRIRAGKEVVKP